MLRLQNIMAQAECVSICPDPEDQTGRNVEILLLNPGRPLHQLVDRIKSTAENGISIIPLDEELIRAFQPKNDYVPGWLYSSGKFEHEGFPDTKIHWYGRQEERGRITSLAFVLAPDEPIDIMELATMDQEGNIFSPIPYLRGVPCTDAKEVVRVTDHPQPTEEQLRSLAELFVERLVPGVFRSMLGEIGPRTAYNAFRIVIPETSKEGTPFLKLKKYDASTNLPPLRAAS